MAIRATQRWIPRPSTAAASATRGAGLLNGVFYGAVHGRPGPDGTHQEGLGGVLQPSEPDAVQAAARIWMRASQLYVNEGTTIPGFRDATIQAAQDIYTNHSERDRVTQSLTQMWARAGL